MTWFDIISCIWIYIHITSPLKSMSDVHHIPTPRCFGGEGHCLACSETCGTKGVEIISRELKLGFDGILEWHSAKLAFISEYLQHLASWSMVDINELVLMFSLTNKHHFSATPVGHSMGLSQRRTRPHCRIWVSTDFVFVQQW